MITKKYIPNVNIKKKAEEGWFRESRYQLLVWWSQNVTCHCKPCVQIPNPVLFLSRPPNVFSLGYNPLSVNLHFNIVLLILPTMFLCLVFIFSISLYLENHLLYVPFYQFSLQLCLTQCVLISTIIFFISKSSIWLFFKAT